jgi:hypothetical protein
VSDRLLTPASAGVQGYNTDHELSAVQGADAVAFETMLEEWLRPSLVFFTSFFLIFS